MMTRGDTTEKKYGTRDPGRASPVSYNSSDDVESEVTEVSDDSVIDSNSESDQEEFDKNNNISPQAHEAFPSHSGAGKFHFSSEGYIGPDGILYSDMSSNERDDYPLRHHAFDVNGCSSTENPFIGTDEEEELLLGDEDRADSLEDKVFPASRNDEILERHGNSFELRTRHANANENNNSNRKKYRTARAGSCHPHDNNNTWGFRRKMRSVQLSSVRASKGRYIGSEIKPYKGRMISKDGSSNVRIKKTARLDWMSRYSKDIFTTLIDLSWTWVIFLTSLVYIGHWIIFGLIYWLIAFANDDYRKIFGDDPNTVTENLNSSLLETTSSPSSIDPFAGEPCVSHVYDFVSAFLFSMESETTIGYGYRNMGVQCHGAIALLVVQCVLSAIFDTWVIGMCYSRIARPDARCRTTLYSKNAVICTRDGKKCLIVRVANLRKSLLLGVSFRARVIILRAPQMKEEREGHQFMLEQKELNFENENCTMLTAPVEYRHVIDKDSPLFTIPERCLASEKQAWFEIVTIFTGIVEATGMTMHAQTSYLSTEIKYKHRLVPIVSICPEKERYVVDFKKFHDTVPEPENVGCITASRRRGSGLFEQRFEPVVEEADETDDVFDNESQDFDEKCEFCGKLTVDSNHANRLCVCYKSNGLRQCTTRENATSV